jgi:hypothetical protein
MTQTLLSAARSTPRGEKLPTPACPEARRACPETRRAHTCAHHAVHVAGRTQWHRFTLSLEGHSCLPRGTKGLCAFIEPSIQRVAHIAPSLTIEFLIANADASSIGTLSDQRGSKGLSSRSPLCHQRPQLLIANADAPSIGTLSDQRESKGLSYRSPLCHQRPQLLIANLELELHPTHRKLNPLEIPNRKYSPIFHLAKGAEFPAQASRLISSLASNFMPSPLTSH